MKIRVRHTTAYRYDTPASYVIQLLRQTPSNHDGQFVRSWHIDVDHDTHLNEATDAFGNVTHTFSLDGPVNALTVTVEGQVSVQDTGGVVHSTREPFPAGLYLRESELTAPSEALIAFSEEARTANGDDKLETLHWICGEIFSRMTFDTDPTDVATTAEIAFDSKRGVCQDFTHIFISVARALNIPARYVSGYLHRQDGIIDQEAGHAWAEAFVPSLGWIGFDPAHGICTTEHYIRVAAALDYQGAAPVRGTRIGGREETMDVSLSIDQAKRSSQ